jgi:Lrp/AsnC family leucine-responsive transcriptional regulator
MHSVKLDDIDRNILRILQKEGRLTNKELSERINLTTTPTLERVKRLEREKVIQSYSAKVDADAVHMGFNAFASVTLAAHRLNSLDDFTKSVESIPEILACYNTTGEGDFLLHIVTRDVHAYEELIRTKITTLPDVQRLHTSIVLRTIKEQSNIPIP